MKKELVIEARSSLNQTTIKAILVVIFVLSVPALLAPGLQGPFVFDDHVHIVQNSVVAVQDLSLPSLVRAWNSSLAEGTASRPLAMLSFGVNHALHGLSPLGFKATNLAIHLVNGILLYCLALRLTQACSSNKRMGAKDSFAWRVAALTAMLWVLHPINLTPVLYTVQRMTSLSAFFVIFGLLLYVAGRRRISEDLLGGALLMLASLAPAGLAFFAKETAVLYPVFLATLEWSLFRHLPPGTSGKRFLRIFFIVFLTAPLIAGGLYYLTHLEGFLYGFSTRPFSLEERLLTEARVLWFYLRLILLPDLSQFGFFHDDFALSTGLLDPWYTLPAVTGILISSCFGLFFASRFPVVAFAVLFFLGGHLLESTLLPLELVFEHRNYLPSFAILFAVSYGAGQVASTVRTGKWVWLAAACYIALLAATTHLRAWDWSSLPRIAIAEVERHPNSVRANLLAANLLMSEIQAGRNIASLYQQSKMHFEHIRRLDAENLNPLFGLIVLNLHVQKPPDPQWIEELERLLRSGLVGPLRLNTTHFSALVKWQIDGGYAPPAKTMHRLFRAALDNPRFDRFARAGILSAYRAYLDRVLDKPGTALPYAKQAVDLWPERWHYHRRLVEVLLKLKRIEQAEKALRRAAHFDRQGAHERLTSQLWAALETARAKQEGTP